MSAAETAWAVKLRSKGAEWQWVGSRDMDRHWSGRALWNADERDELDRRVKEWREYGYEVKVSRVTRLVKPENAGARIEPDIVLDGTVARMIRDNALDEAERVCRSLIDPEDTHDYDLEEVRTNFNHGAEACAEAIAALRGGAK